MFSFYVVGRAFFSSCESCHGLLLSVLCVSFVLPFQFFSVMLMSCDFALKAVMSFKHGIHQTDAPKCMQLVLKN